jgi:Xaa-Pro aminopeptidase
VNKVNQLTVFQQRRLALVQRMTSCGGGIAVIPTANEMMRNSDVNFSFRPESNFHYLSGFGEPSAVLVIVAGDSPRSILFCRDKDPEHEIWDGFRFGPSAAREQFGFDEAYSIDELNRLLVDLLADQPAVWTFVGRDANWDARINQALTKVRAQVRAGKRAPDILRDVGAPLAAMRAIKDETELAAMRGAASISAGAHARAMRTARPGQYEYEVEAELLHEFRRHGCDAPAYPSIVAAGANACVLHYLANNQVLQDGDLLLIDAGGEFYGYASDITRTFPVNGKFSGAQAAIYSVVLEAQAAAIASIVPGAHFMTPHEAAVRVLAQGMLDLKLLTGSLDGVLESESYKRFYMHRTGHWLGRDVHDVGDYKRCDLWTPLQPGMVLTVEPGFYVRPADDIDSAYWNIGVRIEDDVAVTQTGSEVLSAAAPKAIKDIEAWMRG